MLQSVSEPSNNEQTVPHSRHRHGRADALRRHSPDHLLVSPARLAMAGLRWKSGRRNKTSSFFISDPQLRRDDVETIPAHLTPVNRKHRDSVTCSWSRKGLCSRPPACFEREAFTEGHIGGTTCSNYALNPTHSSVTPRAAHAARHAARGLLSNA